MVIYRRFLVTSCMLISLCALGTCQEDMDGSSDLDGLEGPHESMLTSLPPFSSDDLQDILVEPSKAEATSKLVTTQAPTEKPQLPKADIVYSDKDGNVCWRLCVKAQFEIPYTARGEEGQITPRTAFIPFTDNVERGGDCGTGKNKDKHQELKLQWGGGKYLFNLEFSKTRSGDTDNWLAEHVEFTYDTRDTEYFPDAENPGSVLVRVDKKAEFFETPWKNSYTCKADDSIAMSSDDKMDRSFLRIDEIQIQPFMTPAANGSFSEGEPCEADKLKKPTSNVASVAVGATLGCLILIVIIIYAVGRRMGSITDRTGYKAVE